MLYAVYVHNPHAHARVTSVDTSEAEKMPGVKAVHVAAHAGHRSAVAGPGNRRRRRYHGKYRPPWLPRKIKVEYEILPHLVKDDDLGKAAGRSKQGAARKSSATPTRPSRMPKWSPRATTESPSSTIAAWNRTAR